MYAIRKNGEILYIVEEKLTQKSIEDMGGDECVEYNPQTSRVVILENLET